VVGAAGVTRSGSERNCPRSHGLPEPGDEDEVGGEPNSVRRRQRIELTAAGSRKLRASPRAAERAEHDVLARLAPKRLNAPRDLMLDAYAGSRSMPAHRA
jgi:hypothetical protein